MSRLSTSEAARFDATLKELYAVVPIDAFPVRALRAIQQLVGFIHASYNEVDFAGSTHSVLLEPAEMFRSDLDGAFARYFHQHPVIAHVAVTHDTRSLLITDFITPAAFRRLELYNELYRHVDTETQLSITLPTGDGDIIAFALNRGRSGFGERDRLLLDRLGPHLAIGHNNARRLSDALTGVANQDRQRSAIAVGRLTDRQREILALVAEGKTNAQIAYSLGISTATAKKHLEHIARRLQVDSRTAAAAIYLRSATHPAVHERTSEANADVADSADEDRHSLLIEQQRRAPKRR